MLVAPHTTVQLSVAKGAGDWMFKMANPYVSMLGGHPVKLECLKVLKYVLLSYMSPERLKCKTKMKPFRQLVQKI